MGEDWTVGQKEVWSVVEMRWEKLVAADYKFMEDGIHADAVMWPRDKNAPLNKAVAALQYDRWITYARPVSYEIKPYSIQIIGDIANVMYSYRWKAERKFSGYGRSFLTFKKENDKWLIISSLDASCEKLPYCLDW
jgi:hypothetical protein